MKTAEEIYDSHIAGPPFWDSVKGCAIRAMQEYAAQQVREARRKYFLSAYPDADELEIEAYLNKFPEL